MQIEVPDNLLADISQQKWQARGGWACTNKSRNYKRCFVPRSNSRFTISLITIFAHRDVRRFSVLFYPMSKNRALAASRRSREYQCATGRISTVRCQLSLDVGSRDMRPSSVLDKSFMMG